jgi:hypothetical protein
MTKPKTDRPYPLMTTVQTTINLDPEVATYALWLGLNTSRYIAGNLDGVVTQMIVDAICERMVGDPQQHRSFHRWVAARLRGRPMNQRQRDMMRRGMVQRITAIRRRNEEAQAAG